MLSNDQNKSTSNYYTCQTCGSLFTCLEYYQQHRKAHVEKEGITLYTCSHCTYYSDNTFHFNWHAMTHASQPPHRCATCHPGYNEEEATGSAATAVASTSNIATTLMASTSHGRTSSLAIHLDTLEGFEDINEDEIGEGIAETLITFGKRTVATSTHDRHFEIARRYFPNSGSIIESDEEEEEEDEDDDDDDDFEEEEGTTETQTPNQENAEHQNNAEVSLNQLGLGMEQADEDDDDAATVIDDDEATQEDSPQQSFDETGQDHQEEDDDAGVVDNDNVFSPSPDSFADGQHQLEQVVERLNDPYDFKDDDDDFGNRRNVPQIAAADASVVSSSSRNESPGDIAPSPPTTSTIKHPVMPSINVKQEQIFAGGFPDSLASTSQIPSVHHQPMNSISLTHSNQHHQQQALHNFQAMQSAMFIQAPPGQGLVGPSHQQLQAAKAPAGSMLSHQQHAQQIITPMAALLNNFTILPNGTAASISSAAGGLIAGAATGHHFATTNGGQIRLLPLGTPPAVITGSSGSLTVATSSAASNSAPSPYASGGLTLTYRNGQPAMVATAAAPAAVNTAATAPKPRAPRKPRRIQPIEPNPNTVNDMQAISLIDNYVPRKGLGKGNRKPRINVIHVINGVTVGSDGVRRKFHCSHCGNGKSFKTKSHLQRHMLTHTGEKPYVCEDCGARFNQSSSLRNHKIAIHTKVFPHTCFTCGKGFLMPAVLQKHCQQNGHTPFTNAVAGSLGTPATPSAGSSSASSSSGGGGHSLSMSQPATPPNQQTQLNGHGNVNMLATHSSHGDSTDANRTTGFLNVDNANNFEQHASCSYQATGDDSNGLVMDIKQEAEDDEDMDDDDDDDDDDEYDDDEDMNQQLSMAQHQQQQHMVEETTLMEQHLFYGNEGPAGAAAAAGPGTGPQTSGLYLSS